MFVGEHGTYPKTEKGQVQYPRYQFFKQIVEVYKSSGRSVPLFNDKHLSWNWDVGEGDVRHVEGDGLRIYGWFEFAGDVADSKVRDADGDGCARGSVRLLWRGG